MTKKNYALILISILLTGVIGKISFAADKVVVIPLGGTRVVGDAMTSDVLTGKTFSSNAGVGLIGTYEKGAPAAIAKTGQTATVPLNLAPVGSDGNLKKGISWPTPRFLDHGNGTVTDNLTGLIWLANANCTETVGGVDKDGLGKINWANALTWTNNLATGSCGLTDGSKAEDWRLPNANELESLRARQYFNPTLTNDAGINKWGTDISSFSNVQSDFYWSSTTYVTITDFAWRVSFNTGHGDSAGHKTDHDYYVWPVRD